MVYLLRKILALLTLVLIANFALAQKEQPAYKAVADSFEKNYNAENIDAIFSSFSPEMQKDLPLDKAKAFFKNLQQQGGKMISRTFVKYEQSFASYKTKFEKGLYAVNISVDANSRINGFYVKRIQEAPERNTTKLALPFKEEWTVVWGGDTRELNYHVKSEAQKNAFDLVIVGSNGRSYKTNGKTNEDYYAFGKELIAPCDGEVVLVVDGIKDNTPGVLNPVYVPGNTVIIKTINNEYLFFAHFKQHSIVVKQGQKVKEGQLLGRCGNSGNSSEPHLHFHIQNVEDMNAATGIKCYFEKILVNGQPKSDYSPIQHEKIKNL